MPGTLFVDFAQLPIKFPLVGHWPQPDPLPNRETTNPKAAPVVPCWHIRPSPPRQHPTTSPPPSTHRKPYKPRLSRFANSLLGQSYPPSKVVYKLYGLLWLSDTYLSNYPIMPNQPISRPVNDSLHIFFLNILIRLSTAMHLRYQGLEIRIHSGVVTCQNDQACSSAGCHNLQSAGNMCIALYLSVQT